MCLSPLGAYYDRPKWDLRVIYHLLQTCRLSGCVVVCVCGGDRGVMVKRAGYNDEESLGLRPLVTAPS